MSLIVISDFVSISCGFFLMLDDKKLRHPEHWGFALQSRVL